MCENHGIKLNKQNVIERMLRSFVGWLHQPGTWADAMVRMRNKIDLALQKQRVD
jgi:hypothetical protein